MSHDAPGMPRSAFSNLTNRPSLGPPSRRQSTKPQNPNPPQSQQQRRGTRGPSMAGGPKSSLGGGTLSRNPSLSGSRSRSTSTAGNRMSRGASLNPRMSLLNEPLRDPRTNMKDKGYMRKSAKRLVNFLLQNEYSEQIPNLQNAPNARDVFNMFRFLYLVVDPSHHFSENLQEEVPMLFRDLGYPVKLTKSQLMSPGSPHVWPHILAALVWLVDLCEYDICVREEEDEGTGEFEQKNQEKLFFNYMATSYERWLQGEENFSLLEAEFQKKFEEKNAVICRETDIVTEENVQLAREAERLENEPSRIATLSRKKNEFEEDIVKFQRYAEKLEAQRKACIERVEALAIQCQQTKEEMERVAAEREELASIVAAQDLSPEDVERICKAKASLEETLQSITAQKAEVEKTIWEREMSISKCMDDVERLIFQFNTLSTELRLTSVKKTKKERREGGEAEKKETEETQICLPDLSFKAHAATAAEMMNVDLKGQVRTQLEAFHASLVSKVYKAQETELRVLDQLEANEDLVAERREEVQTLENLAQKLKQTYHQEKESLLSALRQKSQQTERLEKEAERLRQDAERLSKDSREKLSATNAELEKLQRKCEEEKEAVAECIFETLNVMMEHKSSVTTSLEALERYLRQEIALLEAAPSSASYEAVLDGIKG